MEIQSSREDTVQEVPGACGRDLPGEGAHWGRCPLDLLFANREGLVGDAMVGGHLGHSDHEIMSFKFSLK